jgi:hypothetical protein
MIRPGGVRGDLEAQVPQRESRLDDSRFRETVTDFNPTESVEEILAEYVAPGRVAAGAGAIPEESMPS